MLLSVKQAASYACVSASLVYQWCKQKLLPHRRVGIRGRGKILIKPLDLDAFLDGFQVAATQPTTMKLRHIK